MNGVIFILPPSDTEPLHYWQLQDGAIAERGVCPVDQLAATIADLANDARVMALVAPADAVVQWHDLGDLPQKQAEAAAALKAAERSPVSDDIHAAAERQADGSVLTAQISADYLRNSLDILSAQDINPDVILPMALAVNADTNDAVAVEIAGFPILRGPRLAAPDELALREILVGGADIRISPDDAIEQHLVSAFATPAINLRSENFAKNIGQQKISRRQWGILAELGGTLALISLLLAFATYWKYSGATARENDRALVAAQRIAPGVTDITQAESEIGKAMTQSGAQSGAFLTHSSALYAALESAESARLGEMRFGNDAILHFSLTAPSADSINPVLVELQYQGFKVTAKARQEASGQRVADISMRMP